MAAVNSTMQALGTPASDFTLKNVVDSRALSLDDFANSPLLVMFICNHCPYVVHIIDMLSQTANEARSNGFAVFAISSNDQIAYPQDGPDAMQSFAKANKFEFPYLFDETQEVAKAYGAACTPDFFVYDAEHKLRYRGQMDDSRPGNTIPVTATDLVDALNAVKTKSDIKEPQIPSIGCNIKWRAGNAPDYF